MKRAVQIVYALLDRGAGSPGDTSLFDGVKHPDLVARFRDYLDLHRHFLGVCHIEQSHALNEKGVDLLLRAGDAKIGFQLKSHYDVSEEDFARNVKRQLAESTAHGLDRLYILVCAPLVDAKRDYTQKISHLLNELSTMELIPHSAYGPTNTVRYFQGLPAIPRDELIRNEVIGEEALKPEEKGYEHMPELEDDPNDKELMDARERVESFLDDEGDWPTEPEDMDELTEAFQRLNDLGWKRMAQKFVTDFLPTVPEEIRQKRDALTTEIQSLLEQCRACESWGDRSESKLGPYLEDVPEEMIPYTSLPNLLRIKENLQEYLSVHQAMPKSTREEATEAEAGDGVEESQP